MNIILLVILSLFVVSNSYADKWEYFHNPFYRSKVDKIYEKIPEKAPIDEWYVRRAKSIQGFYFIHMDRKQLIEFGRAMIEIANEKSKTGPIMTDLYYFSHFIETEPDIIIDKIISFAFKYDLNKYLKEIQERFLENRKNK